jgi:hypothetical protein
MGLPKEASTPAATPHPPSSSCTSGVERAAVSERKPVPANEFDISRETVYSYLRATGTATSQGEAVAQSAEVLVGEPVVSLARTADDLTDLPLRARSGLIKSLRASRSAMAR